MLQWVAPDLQAAVPHPIPRCLPCSKGWKLPRLSLGAKSSPGEGVTHSPLNQRQRCYQPVEPAAPPQRSPGWEPDGSSTAPCLPRCLGPTFASRGRWKSPLCPRDPQLFLPRRGAELPPHVPLAGAVAVSLCPLCVSSLSPLRALLRALPPLLPALGAALAFGGSRICSPGPG